jgi:hypothetical protein
MRFGNQHIVERSKHTTMRSAESTTNEFSSEQQRRGVRVVIVGGWSPGPLAYLKRVLSSQQGMRPEIVEPKNLGWYMPPFPGLWCCHPAVVVATVVLGAILYFSFSSGVHIHIVQRLLMSLFALGWCRILVAVVVRTSIDTSIRTVLKEGLNENNDEIDPNKVLIVGFSWGGCVVAEMIAKGLVGGADDQPSALLIAPTTSLVAKAALLEDAACRITGLEPYPSKISVVHGEYDATFCPNQNRWDDVPGVTLQVLHDDHVFLRPSSLRTLQRILLDFLQE